MIFMNIAFDNLLWGKAPADMVDAADMEGFRRWLERGFMAGMAYMRNWEEIRLDPRLLLEGAQSVLSFAFPYAGGFDRPVADYALGNDYHDVVRDFLGLVVEQLRNEYGGRYRICVDSAPVFERYWAERCGLGRRGRNGLVFVPGAGSRVFLAEIISTLPVSKLPEPPLMTADAEDYCINCGRCIKACPANALQDDGTVDARRCLSYLTIEHRGDWDDAGTAAMHTPAGRRTLFGCDICQKVCPVNRAIADRGDSPAILPGLLPRREIMEMDAAKALEMDQESFSRTFRASPVKRTRLAGLQRNARNISDSPDVLT